MRLESDMPLLSVIVPAYNAEPYIEKCLGSILEQTFGDFEVLIADDKSTDKTKELIDKNTDKRIRRFHNETNRGKNETVNRLFQEARGRYITVHDADDWSDIERFEKQIAWLEKEENHLMCGTGFDSYDVHLNKMARFEPLREYASLKEAIRVSGQFHGPTMIFGREGLEENRIYRPYFKDYHEDVDLAYRLFQKGICTNLAEPLYHYRLLEDSLCRKDYTVKNSHLYKVVVHLADQREKYGQDDLQKNEEAKVEAYFDEITAHYREDKGLIYREGAGYYLYLRHYAKAVRYGYKAVKKDPLAFINWRTLQYVIRKSLLARVKLF